VEAGTTDMDSTTKKVKLGRRDFHHRPGKQRHSFQMGENYTEQTSGIFPTGSRKKGVYVFTGKTGKLESCERGEKPWLNI